MLAQCHRLYKFKGLTHQILHTKFQGNWSSGSGEEGFFYGFYHI